MHLWQLVGCSGVLTLAAASGAPGHLARRALPAAAEEQLLKPHKDETVLPRIDAEVREHAPGARYAEKRKVKKGLFDECVRNECMIEAKLKRSRIELNLREARSQTGFNVGARLKLAARRATLLARIHEEVDFCTTKCRMKVYNVGSTTYAPEFLAQPRPPVKTFAELHSHNSQLFDSDAFGAAQEAKHGAEAGARASGEKGAEAGARASGEHGPVSGAPEAAEGHGVATPERHGSSARAEHGSSGAGERESSSSEKYGSPAAEEKASHQEASKE